MSLSKEEKAKCTMPDSAFGFIYTEVSQVNKYQLACL